MTDSQGAGRSKVQAAARRTAWAVGMVAALALAAAAQYRGAPGHSIGKVSVRGHLIVMDLNSGALGSENLFDLQGRTLRFTPGPGGYRISDLPLQWHPNRGQKLTGPAVNLGFAFPFSGRQWRELSVGASGSIRMGAPGPPRHFGAFVVPPRGGVSVPRFAQMARAAGALVNAQPAICVFFKPRMSGDVYVNQDAHRVLLTWDVTLPYGGIQDWHWFPTVNQFQAELDKDGSIVLSYRRLAARDGIVGVYPQVGNAAARPLAVLRAARGASAAAPAGAPPLRSVAVAAVGGVMLRVTFRAASALPAPGSHGASRFAYQVRFAPPGGGAQAAAEAAWTVAAFSRQGGGLRYVAFGPGVSRQVEVKGRQLAIEGVLPQALQSARALMISASVPHRGGGATAVIPPHRVRLRGLRDPEVHFASLPAGAGPYPVAYEAFHYYRLPDFHNLACTVIKALGDKFDFLVYYSDFRVDNQEAGTPSNGPRGHGAGGPVTGLGPTEIRPYSAAYCSAGRFQWGFIQPVSATAIQMQAYPPADAPILGPEDITYYEKQLGEISRSGRMPPYMYAMSQIGHEMGHRWGAFATAKVNGKIIQLGPVHWAPGLQVRAPFPYVRPTEASIMGGGVWQDNHNGTYTQLDDNYYVPATGYSYLDLYLMGLIRPSEVPNFFLLRHLKYAGKDARGHRIFKADRLDLTIGEVIAADGPRRPDVAHSQRRFNTGMVLVEQHGHQPSALLTHEVNGIRRQWVKYFSIATGRRASMIVNPR